MAVDGGLRARKKARTRAHIAATAARLFGEHGYERVAVADVAEAAEVSPQTVYNHFPTKRDLVFDREDELRDRMVELVRTRPRTASPAAAVRPVVESLVDGLAATPPTELRGAVSRLAATSPEIRRMCLESTDALGDALARAVVDSTPGVGPARAKVHAIGLAWLSQTVIDEVGRRDRDGVAPQRIEREVREILTAALDDLDAAFHAALGASGTGAGGRTDPGPPRTEHAP